MQGAEGIRRRSADLVIAHTPPAGRSNARCHPLLGPARADLSSNDADHANEHTDYRED